MTSSRPRALACSLLGLIASALVVAPALADDDPMACIAASDRGLDLRKQGKLIEARRMLAACAATTCGPDISSVCQKRIADINAALPSVVFTPKDGAGNDVVGVHVSIDGGASVQALDGRPITLDPGPHTFRFEVAGQPPFDRAFVIAEGAKDRQEKIVMGPPASTPAATQATAPGPSVHGSSGSSQRTVGWVIGGAGVLGVAAGSVFGLMASSKWSASQSDCASMTNCPHPSTAVSEHDAAASDGTISTIAFIAGGTAVAVGVLLEVLAPHDSAITGTTRTPLHVAPSVAPGLAGLSLTGAFE